MILLIDNYDSFTFNLYHFLGDLGAEVEVRRNDAISSQDALAMRPDAILLSPGPCKPNEAGICLPLIGAAAAQRVPLLGVCLGHQAIGQFFGGEVVRALYWPRYVFPAAQERWPGIGDHADLERRLRAATGTTGRHVELVAAGPDLLTADLDAVERHLHAADEVAVWPPERNAPCWCGSGAKYKRCCARG